VSRYLRGSIRLASGDRAGASADLERALDVARKSGEGQILCAVLIGEATMLLDEGRRAEATALAAEALDFGERLVNILNDTVIVDAAWVMHDLGRGEEYVSLVDARPDLPWARAAAAICSGEFVQAAEELGRIGYRPGEAYARLRAARKLVEEGRRAEADAELRRALAFWREVGAARYVREGEALLAASA